VSLESSGASPDVPTFRPYFDGAVGSCDPSVRNRSSCKVKMSLCHIG
jgi:hypothetical protein